MFSSIASKFNNIFSSLSSKKIITEEDVEKSVREIRVALLEADVSLEIVKKFITNLKAKLVGEGVIKSVSPAQMIIKITQDEITQILGNEFIHIKTSDTLPTIIMLVGLQGAGKTTTAAKLGNYLKKKQFKPFLASLDTRRPAAQKQLEILCHTNNLESLSIIEGQQSLDITKRAIEEAKKRGCDFLILDTAGRQQVEEDLMSEISEIQKLAKPSETLMVIDAMIGRQSLDIAKRFNEVTPLSGVVLTRTEGDTRGGVALNIRESIGCPIRFYGTGEKVNDFEEFYPDRIASKLLDMGDIVSLVEKAKEQIDEKEMLAMQKKLEKGKFDLDDFLKQLQGLKKMGGLAKMMSFIPGASKLQGFMGEGRQKDLEKQEAIILSMTKKERRKPEIIINSASRKERITKGSGTTLLELNKLLKQFGKMKEMFSKAGGMNKDMLKNLDMEQLKGMLG